MDIFFSDQIVFLVPDDMFDIGALKEIRPDFPIAEPLESPDYFRQLFVGTAISGAFSIIWTNSAALYAVDSTFGRGRYPRRPGTNTYGRGRRPRRPGTNAYGRGRSSRYPGTIPPRCSGRSCNYHNHMDMIRHDYILIDQYTGDFFTAKQMFFNDFSRFSQLYQRFTVIRDVGGAVMRDVTEVNAIEGEEGSLISDNRMAGFLMRMVTKYAPAEL